MPHFIDVARRRPIHFLRQGVSTRTASAPPLTFRNAATNGCRVSVSKLSSKDDLEEVRRIVLRCIGPARARVFLFGSRATGQATPLSDIDVAILPLEPLPDGTLSLIREVIEESSIPYRVDVVDLSTVEPAFRERVLAEGIPWSV